MTEFRHKFIAMIGLITCPRIALAHVDVTIFFIPFWQMAVLVACFFSLRRWPLWRQRGLVASFVLISTVAINVGTADLPYEAHKYWVFPACLLAPMIGWYIGAIFAKRWERNHHA
jgi:hypothetical protein